MQEISSVIINLAENLATLHKIKINLMKLVKNISLLILAGAVSISAMAQSGTKSKEQQKEYHFTTVKANPVTEVKDQNETGTCWCFSTISFLESEAIKKGAPMDIDLSEMFVVSKSYTERAIKYIRLDGSLRFEAGSDVGDVLEVLESDGLVPNSVMPGLNYGATEHIHWELTEGLKGYLQAIVKNPNRKLSTAWLNGFNNILKAYLGEMPQKFTYNGKEYTPKSYAESLGLNKNDFISFTSFTHHPFYEKMVIDVPDNWRWTKSYNIPLDEMLEIMDYAIENGYTVGWVADMSEKSWGDVATIPDFEANDKQITQEIRQIAYDNKETTDDHAMHVYGISKDQNGTKYYMVKNSFGNAGAYNGHNYASESYVRYKTMNILVNKAAVPAHILKKLGM
jgi:aminopeptidase C